MADRRRRWPWVVALATVAVALATWFLAFSPLPVMPEAEAAASEGRPDHGGLAFGPEGPAPVGVIIYTGARIRPAAYAPQALDLAERGIPVFVPGLTLNFAVFDQEAALPIIDAHPEIDGWVIAGHSLGGAMAARLAARGAVDGLVLWAAYPENSLDLAGDPLPVASVYGTRDEIATPDDVLGAGPRLPPDTAFVAVEGGNHAQFGWYGPQRGDGEPTIGRVEQQAVAVDAVISVAERVAGVGNG